MTSCLRVLTASSLDSSPSLLLVSPDGSKTLIDCGEGCQRAFIEYGQKVATVQAVCLTHLSHDALGGLPGFLLTASDIHALNESNNNKNGGAVEENDILEEQSDKTITASRNNNLRDRSWPFYHPLQPTDKAHLHLFGPTRTTAYVRALRHFSRRAKFKVRIFEGPSKDNDKPVPVIPVDSSSTAKQSKSKKSKKPEPIRFSVSCLAFQEQNPQQVVDNAKQHAGQKRQRDDNQQHRPRQTLSYLFTTPSIVGKFLPDKAMELGVPKGPMFAQLKAGQSVTFDNNGTKVTVSSHQVVTPSSPGIGVLILKYPTSLGNLSNFFQSLGLTERLERAGATLDLVVHMAFPHVFSHPTAIQWRESLSSKSSSSSLSLAQVDHMWMKLGDDTGGTPHLSAAATAKVRAQLCPDIFRSPWTPDSADLVVEEIESRSSGIVVTGKPGVQYNLLPRARKGFAATNDTSDKDDTEATRMQEMEESGARQLAQIIIEKENTLQRQSTARPERSKASLLFTGTASAQPCKYRNVTGMLLSNSDGRSMLLDVGEGTVGQLLRMQVSKPDVSSLLASITVAWISHPHADHHLGILNLLENRRATEPLLLIAPPPIFRFLREYVSDVDPRLSETFRTLDCRDFRRPNPDAVAKLTKAIGFTNCQSIQVEHCPYSYAVILDGTPFGRVVYSGDCRPCAKLAAAAKPADLLIHESTFEDNMKSEAFLKKHCTIGEALGIAQAMQARCTVLTHFSQRYPRIPPPTRAVDTTGMRIIFAFDFQCLTADNLQLATQLTPALRLLYPEDEADIASKQSVEAQAQKVLDTPGLFANSKLI